jgi:hypothetical protein
MKKLTAGIFASILGLTAMGAADAAVTSKQYVDNAIKAAKTAVTESIAGDYATTEALAAETNARTQADSTLQGNIDTLTTNTTNKLAEKADKSYVGTIPSTSSSTNVVDYVVEKTSGIASEGAITELDGRLDIIEGDYVTEQELTVSQTNQNTEIKAAYEAADATVLQDAKNYADQNDDDTVYDDAEVRGLISGNTTEINTIKGEQTTQNEAIQGLQNAGYITNAALTGYATENWVETKGYATKAEAEGYANAKDTAISAAQTAAENAQTTASEAAEAAAAAAKISTQKGNDGVYVLTATVAGDSTTYKWEIITRNGTETDETTVTPALPEGGE